MAQASRTATWLLRLAAAVLALVLMAGAAARPFTVPDEIGLAHFGDPYTGKAEAIQFSPDGQYFAVLTERGRLDVNRPESSLRIYQTEEVLECLRGSNPLPRPIWTFSRSTAENGPIITHWRWLPDSSGISFLERHANGSNRLVLANVRKMEIEPLTPEGETIRAFDMRDKNNYVYAVADQGMRNSADAERQAAIIIGTDHTLADLLFPTDQNPQAAFRIDRSELWAVIDGRRSLVRDKNGRDPVVLFGEGQRKLVLSPDGRSLITALALPDVPITWERLYPSPFAAYPYHVRSGPQDLNTLSGQSLASEYVHVDLQAGSIRSLTHAPTSESGGWWENAVPAWSNDGQAVLLPDTFVFSATQTPSRPCVARVNLETQVVSCIEPLTGPTASGVESNYRLITAVHFARNDNRRVAIRYRDVNQMEGRIEYEEAPNGQWIARSTDSAQSAKVEAARGTLKVAVRQGLSHPPVLVGTDTSSDASKLIYDPNPQLSEIDLGEAAVYKWVDQTGRAWKGGLFKPVPYQAGRTYPLVIQTHGFDETQFRPSGMYPTAFAARALAASGMFVLQVQECPYTSTPQEVTCQIFGYEAAVHQLAAEGLVDPDRIGIVGFSRTCYYVMGLLTASALRIRAAAITDGVMADYFQYLVSIGTFGNAVAHEYDAIVGAKPFEAGLQKWLQRSPLFNIDRVTSPLLVVAAGRASLLFMWGPHAALRYLNRPTELVLLNTSEHVLTNPSMRLASQGGSVDWFRFWLKEEIDPDPAKAAQYSRWRKLREQRDASLAIDHAKSAVN